MTAHAKLSASGSHRWLYCPGSVAAEKERPQSSSTAAQEGTAAHELAELVLTKGGACEDWIGKTLPENNAFTVEQDMADSVQVYVDYVKSVHGLHEYEHRVDFSEWVPEGFGTADALVFGKNTLHVIDLKFGKGVLVDAYENTQGLLYALGALSDYGWMFDTKNLTVIIVIVQPKRDNISEWVITGDELLKWGEWISQRAAEAAALDAPRVPGEKQCQWCSAKATCPALLKLTHETIATDFDNIDDAANPDTLSDAQLRKALDVKKLVMSWFDAVEQHVFDRLTNGENFTGYKLVNGRSSRQWSDDDDAQKALEDALGDDAFERKLLSVAKAEKLLGKKRIGVINGLVKKCPGAPTLAPQSDKRPPIGASADDFDLL